LGAASSVTQQKTNNLNLDFSIPKIPLYAS
jgi:hypothetical protein